MRLHFCPRGDIVMSSWSGGENEREARGMEWLKRNGKAVIGALVILILLEAVVSWYLIGQFRENYLSGEEALAVALADAGLSRDDVDAPDIALKTKKGEAWYEIAFGADGARTLYRVNAETGEIVSKQVERDAGQ